MQVIGLCGSSNSGKTTLAEKLIRALKARGCRVSVVKHAHKRFDIDRPGKDSFRHREAGAFEVVIASSHRLALVREFEQPAELSVHHLIAELYDGVDWVLVEGFRHADLLKVEVWRAGLGHTAHYADDAFITAVATDDAAALPTPTGRPVFTLDDAAPLCDWLLAQGDRFVYRAPDALLHPGALNA